MDVVPRLAISGPAIKLVGDNCRLSPNTPLEE